MARVLVTGGAGFIGSHVVDLLVEKGHSVTVFDNLSTGKLSNVNKKAIFVWGDIRNSAELDVVIRESDVCVHLAAVASVAKSTDSWAETSSVNAVGTAAIYELAAKRRLKKVVYASSAAIYGVPMTFPIEETDRAAPLSPYGADKYVNELYGRAAASCFSLKSIGLRFFNVYGPRQDPSSPYSGVISAFVNKVKNKEDVVIYGDGKQTRDFIFVDDVARSVVFFVENDVSTDVFNVCSSCEISIRDLADKIFKLSGCQPNLQYMPERTGDIKKSLGSNLKLASVVGELNCISLDDGLRELLAYENFQLD